MVWTQPCLRACRPRGRGAPDFDDPASPHFLKVQVPL